MGCAGFVLTGGQSRRMGRDKALLPYGGATLVECVARAAAEAAGSVALVGAPERYAGLGFETLGESYPGCGPLSGIEAALSLGRAEWNLIVACDAAGVTAAGLRALLEAAQSGGAAVTAAENAPQRPSPLCAVWRLEALPAVREALAAGQYRVWEAARRAGLATARLPEPVLNVNTPADWAAAGGR
jgi:molybdopterin-guanine dinucleotide biosynthesis protein A